MQSQFFSNKYLWMSHRTHFDPGHDYKKNPYHLRNVADESYRFFTELEDQYGGDIKNMIDATNLSIDLNKINVAKEYKPDR